MKRKTLRKISKRKKGREYHYLDASVIIASFMLKEKYHAEASSYLGNIGHAYSGCIGIQTVGEVLKKIVEEVKDKETKDKMYDYFYRLFRGGNIKISSFNDKDLKLFEKLRKIDNRVDCPDIIGLCIACREKTDVFMTFDTDVLDSEELTKFMKKRGVKIRSPLKK